MKFLPNIFGWFRKDAPRGAFPRCLRSSPEPPIGRWDYELSQEDREYVERLKTERKFTRSRDPKLRRLHAIAISEMVCKQDPECDTQVEIITHATGQSVIIPPGTPWDEVFPVPEEELEK